MKTALFALSAAVLVVACTDTTTPTAIGAPSADAQAANPVLHRVAVGGSDQDVTLNTDANFSLVAIQYGDGSVAGEWSDEFGQAQLHRRQSGLKLSASSLKPLRRLGTSQLAEACG